ncbi:hypothetical protein CN093_11425 [Sinorhizobium meliloti]|uniref:hypothetical protein n=1 Tax=Rhizobium meliloti TaxID=382 RepID=UPI000FD56377|nr:hypothetical protein [Sinorhizobium meliloti]RVO40440.1 hypothetical protein CN093_11425 [Sinorhizobium meliloti]
MDIRPSDKVMRWLGPAVIVTAFCVFIFGAPPVMSGWCTGAPDEHCLRDWLSATSGWFAGIAAFGSIVFLAQQVRDTRSHYDSMVRTQQTAEEILASRAKAAAESCKGALSIIAESVAEPIEPKSAVEWLRTCAAAYGNATQVFGRRALDDFDEKYYLGYINLSMTRSMLDTRKALCEAGISSCLNGGNAFEMAQQVWEKVVENEYASKFCDAVIDTAGEILTHSRSPLPRPRAQ